MNRYVDRAHAGRVLAEVLEAYRQEKNLLVLALPRGGVPVAFEVAKALKAPLDVLMVRKLGVPGHQELAMGAIAEGGQLFLNRDIIQQCQVTQAEIEAVTQKETKELARRQQLYRGERAFPELKNKNIILIDDGIATGASLRVAIEALKQFYPNKIIVAVPVADPDVVKALSKIVDDFVCPLQPTSLNAVGNWYEQFPPVEDETVQRLLRS